MLLNEFNYKNFKLGQEEIIRSVLKKQDVLGVLPTGSGKSICYQLPAKILPGLTIVISPLTSLMIDQVKELKAIKYKNVAALNGMIDWKERRQILNNLSLYKLLYISPELFQSKEVIQVLKQIEVSLVVIDEAHCISQWGYDFRPDYLRIINQINLLNNPTILALTATASETVRLDIKQVLSRPQMKEIIYPIDRENIIINVKNIKNEIEKKQKVSELLIKHDVPTLIYFSSRKKCEEVSAYLANHLNKHVAYYHGGLDNSDRLMIQQQFMNNQLNIICCTAAFGMGINKKDIRLIIHYHLPLQIESYIQEIGRAGRDGKESTSVLFFDENDVYLPLNIIENQFLSERNLKKVLDKLSELIEIPNITYFIESNIEINEVQWRNIKYHLENHDMINKSELVKDRKKWLEFTEKMIKYNKEQVTIKQNELNTLVNWIKTKKCLRVALYNKFQATIKKPLTYCCSSCDFDIFKWQTKSLPLKDIRDNHWKKKLAILLQVGEKNESS